MITNSIKKIYIYNLWPFFIFFKFIKPGLILGIVFNNVLSFIDYLFKLVILV